MIKKSFFIFTVLFIFITSGYTQNYTNDTTPQRIILNVTTEPSTSMAVTWRTIVQVENPQLQVAQAGISPSFAENAKNINARTEKILTDTGKTVYYYSGIMDGLTPNTLYAYRVGGGETEWSEWNQFTTAESKNAPFKFVFFGDTQDDVGLFISRVFREAFKIAPDASFWLFAGDITNDPEDEQLENLYRATGFVFRMVPSILAPGNHDRMFKIEDGKIVVNKRGWKERIKDLSPFWRGQFTLPENGVPGLEESCYYIDYQGVRIIILNSNDKLQDQAVWMEKILSNNPNKWTIISFHHPLYSVGGRRDEQETRKAFLALFDKYNVDLVLNGHDHVYARSYKLKNGVKVKDNEPGTVYIVSLSSPKAYPYTCPYPDLMEKTGKDLQLFQVISIDSGKISYKAYTAIGSLYDSFELTK